MIGCFTCILSDFSTELWKILFNMKKQKCFVKKVSNNTNDAKCFSLTQLKKMMHSFCLIEKRFDSLFVHSWNILSNQLKLSSLDFLIVVFYLSVISSLTFSTFNMKYLMNDNFPHVSCLWFIIVITIIFNLSTDVLIERSCISHAT